MLLFLENWLMKLKISNLRTTFKKIQLANFYLSESILKKHFNVRHPVFYVILNFVCFSESPNFKYDIFSQVFVQGVPMGDKQKFLQRERSALTRRRQIFGEKLPNKMVYLTPKSDRRSDNFVVDNFQDLNFKFLLSIKLFPCI